jgi:hypothetical protein
MKKFLITEEEKNRIIDLHTTATKKLYLSEKYEGGLIMEGDDLCDIECEDKLAAYGSKGEAVKEIQHALAKCGYNAKYEGGGMKSGCGKDKNKCDGKFKEHTRDAVKEFQKENGLFVDGKVGAKTLSALVDEGCLEDPQCDCEDQTQTDFDDTKSYEDILNDVDCENLKNCVFKHIINTPAPDYNKFMGCLNNNENSLITDEMIKYADYDGELKNCKYNVFQMSKSLTCPKTLNCMPGPKKDMSLCNSKFIAACKKAECTNVTY